MHAERTDRKGESGRGKVRYLDRAGDGVGGQRALQGSFGLGFADPGQGAGTVPEPARPGFFQRGSQGIYFCTDLRHTGSGKD